VRFVCCCRPTRRRSTSVEKPDSAGGAAARDSSSVEATSPATDQVTPPVLELTGSATSNTLSPGLFTSRCAFEFLDPEGGSQQVTLVVVVVVVVVISSLKIPKAFLIRSGAQRNCVHIRADIPADLPSQIFTYFLINE